MKFVIQRVKSARVLVEGKIVGSIGHGLLILAGFHKDDTMEDIEWIIPKTLKLRVFPDKEDKFWNANVMEQEGEILVVSQFTLIHGLRGTRPDFHLSMKASEASIMYKNLVDQFKAQYNSDRIATGAFQEMMEVESVNQGPITLLADSRQRGGLF